MTVANDLVGKKLYGALLACPSARLSEVSNISQGFILRYKIDIVGVAIDVSAGKNCCYVDVRRRGIPYTVSVSFRADIDLAVDSFHSQFADAIPLSEQTRALPDLNGSGQVRSLREAASLASPEGEALAGLLTAFSHATSKAEQKALLDPLIRAWAATSAMPTTFTGAYAGRPLTVDMQIWQTGSPAYYAVADMLTIMERFNGRTYQPIPPGSDPVTLTLWHFPQDMLRQSYDVLKSSVYDSLILQTRLKPYLEAIEIEVGESGVALKFGRVRKLMEAKMDADPVNGIVDLLDFNRSTQTLLTGSGWDGTSVLMEYIGTHPLTDALRQALSGSGVRIKGTAGWGNGGSASDDILLADGANDYLYGYGGNDTLLGGGGSDQLYGGTGNDILDGGAGNDQLYGGDGNNWLAGYGNDTYLFGKGDGTDTIADSDATAGNVDSIRFKAGVVAAEVSATRPYNTSNDLLLTITTTGESIRVTNWFADTAYRIERVVFDDGTIWDAARLATAASGWGDGNDVINGGIGNDSFDGGPGNDVMYGNAGNDSLSGGSGNDVIYGNAGNDLLDGSVGVDTLIGGAGNDTYVVDSSADVVIELAGEGTDTVLASASVALAVNIENLTLTGTAAISGTGNALDNVIVGNSGNNSLYGLAGNDSLTGNAGNDLLDGGTGTDTLAGGLGDDTYVVDDAADIVLENAGEGSDTVQSAIDYALADALENLTLTGAAQVGAGNTANNVLTGNEGDNTLYGLAGNDTLTGNGGNDLLDGGMGADTMAGGTGDDTYIVDNAGDLLTEAAAAGNDTVTASVDYTLTANVENLVLTGAALNGTGNALDNILTGTAANNVLDGGAGADTLLGALGDDTYIVDNSADVVVELTDEGIDTVLASASTTLSDNIENLTLTGAANIDGTGNALANVLTGNAGINVLTGGAGDDIYVVNDTLDTVVEHADEGIDTVRAAADYTLSANVEQLILTGTANLSATGNAQDNTIIGNAGNNLLDGGLGADLMVGGLGNDTYVIDNAADQVTELAAGVEGGVDTVQANVDHTLADNVENLVLTGSNNLAATGNALDNVLTGNTGNNVLDGSTGADQMAGGLGDDTYVVDQAGDGVSELAGEGTDTVRAAIAYTLGANVENLTLTGSANIDGTGNALDNVLTGNAGSNLLFGGEGNDTLDGGAGNDILMGGAGNDAYIFGLGSGSDRIVDAQGSDTLFVGSGTQLIGEFNLEAERIGDNLAIHILGSEDFITLDNWYVQTGGIDRIVFGDGATLDRAGIDALRNRPPVANADSITVHEDGGALTFAAAELLTNDTDPNPGDVLNVIGVGTSQVGATVTLADGQVSYDIASAFQALAAGETVNDSFSYTITDSKGAQAASLVNVAIVGTNDAPVTTADTAATVEDAATPTTDNVLGNDTDIDHGTVLRIAAPGDYVGTYGTLSLAADGSYSYALANGSEAVQALAQDQVAVDRFAYDVTDGIVAVGSTLDIRVTGINDAPVVSGDTGQVAEDGILAAAGNVLANDHDIDAGTILRVAASGEYVGTYGTLALQADGRYAYSLHNDSLTVQSLAGGTSAVDHFAYAATDGIATIDSALDITVQGANDAPVTADDTVIAVEDWLTVATGNVLANDSDVDAGTVLQVAAPGTYAGNYGSLTLNADGGYAYALDNAATKVQSLGREAAVVEHFAYTATDGQVGTAATLDVFLHGTNDAPIVVKPLADQDVTFNKPFYWQMPADSFKDVDAGDALTYAAKLADGSALPDWLRFDAQTRAFSGMSPKAVMSLDVRVTATDKVAATGNTTGSLSASDIFTLSISHGNEGVGNGQDAAPAGQATNFNDGAGTSPGNPGAKSSKKSATAITASASLGAASVAPTVPTATPLPTTTMSATGTTASPTDASSETAAKPVPAYLGSDTWSQYGAGYGASAAGTGSSGSSTDPTVIFARWLAMDLAVSKALAEQPTAWADAGADVSVLNRASSGFLGSTTAFGKDALSLLSANQSLQTFNGLGNGTQSIS